MSRLHEIGEFNVHAVELQTTLVEYEIILFWHAFGLTVAVGSHVSVGMQREIEMACKLTIWVAMAEASHFNSLHSHTNLFVLCRLHYQEQHHLVFRHLVFHLQLKYICSVVDVTNMLNNCILT